MTRRAPRPCRRRRGARSSVVSRALLDRTREAGVVRGVVTWDDLLPLMCGIAFAADIHAEDRRTRLESGRRYLAVMLRGMRG